MTTPRWTERLDGVRQDIVFSVRSLRRSPGLSLGIIATLALGLGANAAMFSLLDAVFLRPPAGVVHPDAVRRLWWQRQYNDGKRFGSGLSYPNYQAVSQAFAGRAATAIYTSPDKARLGLSETAPTAQRSYASASFFSVLGARAAIGRLYASDEDQLGQPQHVVVLSDDYWRRAFRGDSSVLGRTLVVERERFVIVGVTAAPFVGADLDATDIWTPLATVPSSPTGPSWWTQNRRNRFLILVRKNGGVDDAELDQRATAALLRPGMAVGVRDSTNIARLGPINAARGPGRVGPEVAIAQRLDGVAIIVLLIACANVINLLLVRAVRRRREIAVRLALGISRGRLVRLLVTESAVLATIAAFVGLLTAYWGGTLLRVELFPDVHWVAPPVDYRVVLFALGVAAIAGVATGLVPAIQSASPNLAGALKSGGREGAVHTSRLRDALVIVQSALSVVLLVGAALFTRSLASVRDLDLGFAKAELLYARPRFESQDRSRDSLLSPRLAELAARLRTIPGVQATALTSMSPISGFSSTSYFPDGVDTTSLKKPTGIFWVVSGDYFRTVGTRLLRGAVFADARGAAAPPSVIVNEAMARALWRDENPIGKCIRFERANAPCNTVVGVVQTARYNNVIEVPTPQLYLPLDNVPLNDRWPASEIAIRVAERDVASVTRAVRTALRETFPSGEPSVVSVASVFEPQYRPWRLGAVLFSSFGMLALIIAAVGMYSAVSYGVTQRMHEFGVRVALGGSVRDVSALVVSEGIRVATIGVACGVVLALAAGRWIGSLLYGIAPTDMVSLVVVALSLLTVALLAAVVPAYRAARVDPVSALRAE